ncbi:hypothetical protein glysoja_049480 [Glycine soja]|uniref:Glycosyl transferase CAP10 domain-containing protein n=1 Tax=Glycine soja TaxID=3848 RepID=A0A0B2PF23_GLYSO|nr:hypothetical protein glysoja_049480 [Glycine soja]
MFSGASSSKSAQSTTPYGTSPFTVSIRKPIAPLNCTAYNLTGTCPTNLQDHQSTPATATCPDYFRWIHEDLRPWARTGITQDMVERAKQTANFRAEINIKPWHILLGELKEGTTRIPWLNREPYAYWKGNPAVAQTRQDLIKCNVSENQDWNARLLAQRILGKVTESEEVKRRLGGESVVTEKKYQEMYVNSPGKGVVDKLKGMVGTWFTNPAENQSSQDSSMNYEAGRAEVEQVNQGAAGERRQQESSN